MLKIFETITIFWASDTLLPRNKNKKRSFVMCVTVGETTLNEVVHMSSYEWAKLLFTHYLTGPLLKTVKLHSLIVLREEWAYTYYLVKERWISKKVINEQLDISLQTWSNESERRLTCEQRLVYQGSRMSSGRLADCHQIYIFICDAERSCVPHSLLN